MTSINGEQRVMGLEMARCGNKSGSEKPDYDKYFGPQNAEYVESGETEAASGGWGGLFG